ncbi:MAG: PEP-CTERM sorting domain-containing protein [Microcystaceae cyanobacterium]
MNKLATATLLAAIALVTIPNAALADVVDGSFESGSFSPGWTTLGDTQVLGPNDSFGIAPTQGDYQALTQTNQSTTGATASNVESFLGLSPGSLTNLGATEGSAIQQTLFAGAGTIIFFDWNFLTDLVPGSSTYNDFAFVTLDGNLTILANTETPNVPSFFSPFAAETLYASSSITVTTTGNHNLGFGVVDVDLSGGGDTSVNSGLLVDKVEAVPEPLTILGSFAAIAFGAACNKKRDQN